MDDDAGGAITAPTPKARLRTLRRRVVLAEGAEWPKPCSWGWAFISSTTTGLFHGLLNDTHRNLPSGGAAWFLVSGRNKRLTVINTTLAGCG